MSTDIENVAKLLKENKVWMTVKDLLQISEKIPVSPS